MQKTRERKHSGEKKIFREKQIKWWHLNMVKKIKNALKSINSFNQKQWFWASCITTTAGIWYSLILNFWGLPLGLVQTHENVTSLTTIGTILTILTVAWSFLSFLSQRYCDYHNSYLNINEDTVNEAETMYETVSKSVSNVSFDIVSRKIQFVEKVENNETQKPSKIITKPCLELKRISEEIAKTLSRLLSFKKFNLRENDLSVNIYYRFPLIGGTWNRADYNRNETGLTIDALFGSGTTFDECMNSREKYVFYNSKEEAKKHGHYVIVSKDEMNAKGELKGAILCYMFSVYRNNKHYIDCMISISTYGKQFTKDDSEIVSYNIKNNVLSEYEPLIKNALCDLYVHQLIQ